MIQLHLDAILARLRAHPGLASIVFDGAVTGSPSKYVVVYTSTPRTVSSRYTGSTDESEITYTVHSVGVDTRQAIWVADRVHAQLVDFIPTVPGYSCSRLAHPVNRPIAADTSANPALWYAVDQFDLVTSPA